MLLNLRTNIGTIKHNWASWSTDRKILVIESDDWGSVRIPNKTSYNNLLKNGIRVDKCPFMLFDNFEQIEDFNALFEVLQEIHDKHSKSPKITANYIMSNPDYTNIEKSNFKEYNFITLKNKLENENQIESYKKQIEIGISNKWFHPQLHGREHLNIELWMRHLQSNSAETILAFNNNVYGIGSNISTEERRSFLPALDYENENVLNEYVIPSLIEGQNLFKEFFGYFSKSFIAPNYTWDSKIEEVLANNKIEFIQSSRNQIVSKGAVEIEGKLKYHKTGDKNKTNQFYLVRNAIFEPSTVIDKKKHLATCLKQINLAFMFNKPAILSIHRLNFMGGLNKTNRKDNLQLFKKMIEYLINKYPEIEFISSDELGEIIKKNSY